MALASVDASGRITNLPRGDWETINSTLERIAVPGGWLYRLHAEGNAMVFVASPASVES